MFWLPNASCHQAMGSTAHALPFVSRQSNANGVFRSPLFQWVLVFWEVWFQVVSPAVCCCTSLSLCFLIIGILASGILIPLFLSMLLGWSPLWIISSSPPAVSSWNVMIYISSDCIVRQAMKPFTITTNTTRMNNNLFYCINSETFLNVSKHETCCVMQAYQWVKLPNFCSLFFSWTVRMQVTAGIYFTFCIFICSFKLSSGFLFNIR